MSIGNYLKKISLRYTGSNYTLKESLKKESSVTCLVARIFDFENFVLQNSLQHVGVLMDKFYTGCAQEMMCNHGSVNNFCGNNVIGFFGLYEQEEMGEERACKSAIQIYESLRSKMDLGFGICSGQIIHGEFGNNKRAIVTGFGLPINCASQLSEVDSKINICDTIVSLIPDELQRYNAIRVINSH